MAQSGDSILRSLQNNHLPMLDLLVRESVQNSLDASKNELPVEMDFYTGEFSNQKFATILQAIDHKLLSKYADNDHQKFLSIRDLNTTGLTGSYKTNIAAEVEKSNFLKLIFGLGKNQQAEGAGGSWGLGKTSYFRVGNGIVIYYSQVEVNPNTFQERLVVSLIEDPRDINKLLDNSERGIAWWGQGCDEDDFLLPILNSSEIENILNIFGLQKFPVGQTGTQIIIPYLNNEFVEKSEDWQKILRTNIKESILKWYAPRLNNPVYQKEQGQPFLEAFIDDEGINLRDAPYIFFNYIQKLYNAALTGIAQEKIEVFDIAPSRKVMDPYIKDIPGRIALIELNKAELMVPPYGVNRSPLDYFGGEKINDEGDLRSSNLEDRNYQMFTYVRKPGMIIEYGINGEWTPKVAQHKPDHILLGIFVPNSEAAVHPSIKELGFRNIESYLRASENADHAEWKDHSNQSVVKLIKNHVVKTIAKRFNIEDSLSESGHVSGISRKLGMMFLPKTGLGNSSGKVMKEKKSNNTNNRQVKRSSLMVEETILNNHGNLEATCFLKLVADKINDIDINIETQEADITAHEWERIFGSTLPFPYKIINAEMLESNENVELKMFEDSNGGSFVCIENVGDQVESVLVKIEISGYEQSLVPKLAITSRN